jgi:ribosomal protein L11 methyltransferase
MKTWTQAVITPPLQSSLDEWEAFCALSLEAGALGYEEEEGPNPVPEKARFTFPAGSDSQTTAALRSFALRIWPTANLSIEITTLHEEDWGRAWWDFHAPTQATSRIQVGPAGEKHAHADLPTGSHYIALLPSKTFGTGEHPTTRLCLELLEEFTPSPECVLDVGTGSGVLAIAAVKLGAKWAVGIDNDPACPEAFARNTAANHCSRHCVFVPGATIEEAIGGTLLSGVPMPDLVLCNMLSNEFDPLLVPLRHLTRPLILSGFLESEHECIADRLRETGWNPLEWRSLDEWGAVLASPA